MSARERSHTTPGRFTRYFTRVGWIHALLLMGVWLFLFPFAWMLATSVKTDEEVAAGSLLPALPRFRACSPYVRESSDPTKPAEIESAKWDALLPKLSLIADTAIANRQATRRPVDAVGLFDVAAYRRAAAKRLLADVFAQIDRRLWDTDAELVFRARVSPHAIESALDASLAQLRLLTFQLHTLDFHIHNLTRDATFASTWQVESGDARLVADSRGTSLTYQFTSADDLPVVLRHDFELPVGVSMKDIHKMIFSIQSDNSWHRVDAMVDIAGERWASTNTNYLAQFRQASFIFQPPTFDDEVMRPKPWTPLRRDGPSLTLPSSPRAATIRITLSPSSTLRANWGKAFRNFDRAFRAVPFWKFIANSLVLVVLCTAGSLFSASFVAYAFARLHWPGRSIAFMLLLATMMLPSQVTMVPSFMIWRWLGWYNTLNPLWVPSFLGSAFFIFLMTQHMRTIPVDLEEAARIDGLNALQSWYYIILPNVKPTLAAIAILSFMGTWNDFLGPLIYLRDPSRFPLSLGLYGLNLMRALDAAQYPWPVVMAGNVMMTVPVIAVFFLFQRHFVQGMSLSGMKA